MWFRADDDSHGKVYDFTCCLFRSVKMKLYPIFFLSGSMAAQSCHLHWPHYSGIKISDNLANSCFDNDLVILIIVWRRHLSQRVKTLSESSKAGQERSSPGEHPSEKSYQFFSCQFFIASFLLPRLLSSEIGEHLCLKVVLSYHLVFYEIIKNSTNQTMHYGSGSM